MTDPIEHISKNIRNKIHNMVNEEMLQCIYTVERQFESRDDALHALKTYGTIDQYQDGTMVFKWKGKDAVIIHRATKALLTDELEIQVDRLYLDWEN